MSAWINIPNGMIAVDPLNAFPQATDEALLEATGYVGPWVMEAIRREEPFATFLPKVYPWGLSPIPGAEILPNGTFRYPGDPDLSPIFRAKSHAPGGPDFLMYRHAIVAFRDTDEDPWTVTRMD